MLNAEILHQAHHRHARHYLNQLQTVSEMYAAGGAKLDAAVKQLEANWFQISQAYTWSADHMHTSDGAGLCSAFTQIDSRVFELRQPLSERVEWLETGLQAAKSIKDAAAETQHLILLGNIYVHYGPVEKSTESYRQALELAQNTGDRTQQASALLGLGRNYSLNPSLRNEAREFLEKALAIYRDIDDLKGVAWAQQNLGVVYENSGAYAEAQTCLEETLKINRKLNDEHGIAKALSRLASIYERKDDLKQAFEMENQALKLARKVHDHHTTAICLQVLGYIVSRQHDYQASRIYYENALVICRQLDNHRNVANCLLNLGWLDYANEDYTSALDLFDQSHEMYRSFGQKYKIAYTLMFMGFAQLELDRIDRAAENFHASLKIATEIGDDEEKLGNLIGIARVQLVIGQASESARLAGLVDAHMQADYLDILDVLNVLKTTLEEKLSPEDFTSGLAQGRQMDLDAGIQQFLEKQPGQLVTN